MARLLKGHPQAPPYEPVRSALDEYDTSQLIVDFLARNAEAKLLDLEQFFGSKFKEVLASHEKKKARSKAGSARNADSSAQYALLTAVELPDDGPSKQPSLRGLFLPMAAQAAKRVIPKKERGNEKHTAEKR